MQTDSEFPIDQHKLTMAYGYWKTGKSEQEATFQLSFCNTPGNNSYMISCGLSWIIEFLTNFHFSTTDLQQLTQLFEPKFINYLKQLKFSCTISAIEDGILIFPQQPILQISGPLLQCQLLENLFMNLFGPSTITATMASQFCQQLQQPIIELGLSQTKNHASYIGGYETSSAIPSTMSHSWVSAFSSELEAFRTFADINLSQTILLLDTYNAMQGLQNALLVGQELRRRKQELLGVQINTGNIAKLSKKIRKQLDKAGFSNTKIIVNSALDIAAIRRLQSQKAPVDIWAVNNEFISKNLPTANMSYKLVAMANIDSGVGKYSAVGIQQIRRFYCDKLPIQDVIYDTELGISPTPKLKPTRSSDLFQPIFAAGKLVYKTPTLEKTRSAAISSVTNFLNRKDKKYPVIIDKNLLN